MVSVAKKPGEIALEVMPLVAQLAGQRAGERRAGLPWPRYRTRRRASASVAAIEVTRINRPQPRSIMPGTTSRISACPADEVGIDQPGEIVGLDLGEGAAVALADIVDQDVDRPAHRPGPDSWPYGRPSRTRPRPVARPAARSSASRGASLSCERPCRSTRAPALGQALAISQPSPRAGAGDQGGAAVEAELYRGRSTWGRGTGSIATPPAMTTELALDLRMLQLPKVIGHRGAMAYAPENTLNSFREAHRRGATWVEIDVKLTADGVPIVMHDDLSLKRTTGRRPAG